MEGAWWVSEMSLPSTVAVDQCSRDALGAAGGLCCTWGPRAGSMALGQEEKSHLQNILWVTSAELEVFYNCLSIAGV